MARTQLRIWQDAVRGRRGRERIRRRAAFNHHRRSMTMRVIPRKTPTIEVHQYIYWSSTKSFAAALGGMVDHEGDLWLDFGTGPQMVPLGRWIVCVDGRPEDVLDREQVQAEFVPVDWDEAAKMLGGVSWKAAQFTEEQAAREDELRAIRRAALEEDRRDAAAKIRHYAQGYYDQGQREGFEVAAKIAEGWLRGAPLVSASATAENGESAPRDRRGQV